MKKIIFLTFFLSLPIFQPISYGKDIIKIAIANNFSNYATQCSDPLGRHFKNSIDLAIKNFSTQNPMFPYEIKLDVYDYGEGDLKIIDIMGKAYKSDAVAIIGFPCSDQALLAAKLAEENGIVFVSPQATSDKLWNFNNYVFKTCFKNSYQSDKIAALAHNDLKKQNMAIVVSRDCEYCTNIAVMFQKDFEKLGGKVVKVYPLLKSDMNYDALIYDIEQMNVDGIFMANYEFVTSKIISQLVNAGVKTTFFSGDDMGNVEGMLFQLLKGIDFELYAISHWFYDPNDVVSHKFQDDFFNNYGIYPNDNSALAYDAMRYLLEGVKAANKKTREGVKKALMQIRHYDGLRNIRFDQVKEEVSVSLYHLKSSRNKFNLVKRVDPRL